MRTQKTISYHVVRGRSRGQRFCLRGCFVLWFWVAGGVMAQETPTAVQVPRLVSLNIQRGGEDFALVMCDATGGVFAEGIGKRFRTCRRSTMDERGLQGLLADLQRAGVAQLDASYGKQASAEGEQEDIVLCVVDGQKEKRVHGAHPAARPAALGAIVDLLLKVGRAWPEAQPGLYLRAENVEVPMPEYALLTGTGMLRAQFLANLGTAFPPVDDSVLDRYPPVKRAILRLGFPIRLDSPTPLPPGVAVSAESGWAGLVTNKKRFGLQVFTWLPNQP